MGHLISRGLCYLGQTPVLRAPPLNPGVSSPFVSSPSYRRPWRRPFLLIQLPVVLGTPVFLASVCASVAEKCFPVWPCPEIIAESRSSILSEAGFQRTNYIPNNPTQIKHFLGTWGSGLGPVLESASLGPQPAPSAGDRQAQGTGSAHFLRLDPFVFMLKLVQLFSLETEESRMGTTLPTV